MTDEEVKIVITDEKMVGNVYETSDYDIFNFETVRCAFIPPQNKKHIIKLNSDVDWNTVSITWTCTKCNAKNK